MIGVAEAFKNSVAASVTVTVLVTHPTVGRHTKTACRLPARPRLFRSMEREGLHEVIVDDIEVYGRPVGGRPAEKRKPSMHKEDKHMSGVQNLLINY